MSIISASTTSTTAYKVTADTTGTLVLQTGSTPTTAMTIDGSQNVGIGTSSPSAKLHAQVSTGNTIAKFENTVSGSGLGEVIVAAPNRPAVRFNFQTSNDSNGYFNYDTGAFKWFNHIGGSATQSMGIDTSGNLQFNSGYGSVATAYGCRAWVYYNGSRTISGSGNVTSITVLGTGDSQINFTNAMPDANFCAVASTNEDGGTPKYCNPTNPTTAKIRVVTFNSAGTAVNNTYNYVAVFR